MRYRFVIAALLIASTAWAADPAYYRASLSTAPAKADDLTHGARGTTYKPIFGIGGQGAETLVSVARYGELTVAPGGASAMVGYPAEEQLYYILEGSATLAYGDEKHPVKQDDFLYLPVGVPHGFENSSAVPVRVLVMGYHIPPGTDVAPTPHLMIANANDVGLQVLPSHGPTTQFKLLMGATESERDKLTSAVVMTSLFIMDFAPGGTNNPHSHAREEEIYLILRGSGDMVAGVDTDGNDLRHPATAGDVFGILPGTRVGFYSGAREGDPHDIVLAVRSSVRRQNR